VVCEETELSRDLEVPDGAPDISERGFPVPAATLP